MKMIKKVLVAFLIVVALVVVISLSKSTSTYKVEIIKVDVGWGYDIKFAGETYIHQPFIPSIQKTMPFSTKREARKTAYLVVEKLENGKLPTLTIDEIMNLGIFIEDR